MTYVRLLLAVIVVMGVITAVGCPDREPAHQGRVTAVTEPAEVDDQALMVALSQAKNFHHKAKVQMSDGKLDDAIASVREILALHFPAGAPEADDVRNDARALLGKLLVEQGKLDDAMAVVTEGIGASQRDSFFVANLWTVKGEIHEARAAQLDHTALPFGSAADRSGAAVGDATDKARAADEKRAAIEAYDHSIQIDKVIQKRLMEQP